MSSKWREFRFIREDQKDLLWMIKQDGESYQTKHGQVDGAMQINSDTPGPKGVEGTKAFVDAVSNCDFHISREIRKKKEAGYLEFIDGKTTEEKTDKIEFDKLLPKYFCSYKPQSDIKPEALKKLCNKGLARFSRKYDGFCVLMVNHDFGWTIYSRRMDCITGHFPKHIAELNKLSYKTGTILVGEMVCIGEDGLDDFKSISRICRSKEEESLELRSSGEVPEPVFIIFDILFHNEQDLSNHIYDERSKLWKPIIAFKDRDNELITSVDYYDLAFDNWEDYTKKMGWEGFVVADGSAKPGDKFYNFSGKPKRPLGSHKCKPFYEEDCVIYAGLKGNGKRIDYAGSIFIKQIHPKTGKWFDLGKVGSGFNDESTPLLTKMLKEHGLPIINSMREAKSLDIDELTGFVVEIKYFERQPGTNKFKYPVFVRLRPDKDPEECIAQKLKG